VKDGIHAFGGRNKRGGVQDVDVFEGDVSTVRSHAMVEDGHLVAGVNKVVDDV
jgi:hypothetical protein